MNPPACPLHYTCTFTPQQRYVVTEKLGPWWHGGGGLAVGILIVIALAAIIIFTIGVVEEYRDNRRTEAYNERAQLAEQTQKREERQHTLDIEEQRTMQIDAAKGNPEMLKIVKDLQRSPR